jgi:hypothetical protein
MTHSVDITHRENHPTVRRIVTLDITSLDAAGVEEFDPTAEVDDTTRKPVLDVSSPLVVTPVEWEDETLQVMWDSVDGEFKIKNLSDGTDVAGGTAVGEVVVEVTGV